jgi:hypothetical protein
MSVITEGISEREKIIRKKFYAGAEPSYEDCQYLIGVIDTLRWDRRLLRDRLEPLCPDSPDGNHHVAPIGSDEEWMPSKAPCYYCGDKQAL